MLVIFRFVAHVPVPGVDVQALAQAFEQQALLGFLDLFSGGALSNLSIAALGVYPYITSSIVMQILTPVIPQLKALSQEGEYGRQRINQVTHYLAVPVAVFQGWGQLSLLQQSGVLPIIDLGINLPTFGELIVNPIAGGLYFAIGYSLYGNAQLFSVLKSYWKYYFLVGIVGFTLYVILESKSGVADLYSTCLLYTSPSPRDRG
mgnify:CR=1 FL=1